MRIDIPEEKKLVFEMLMPDEPGVLYATGGATTVWIDFPKQQSVPLPEWLRKLF
jgi:acyl-CoA thioesterase FadM